MKSEWILNNPEVKDLMESIHIPCEICGEILCDGFCNDKEDLQEKYNSIK